MSTGSPAYVVDASVAIKLFVTEPLAENAIALFARLGDDPPARLYVPELVFTECANVLWKYVRRFGLPAADARRFLADLGALSLRRVSTAELVADALEIALAHDVTVCDACYVALAHRLGVVLVTADEALVRKLSATPYSLRWLGGS